MDTSYRWTISLYGFGIFVVAFASGCTGPVENIRVVEALRIRSSEPRLQLVEAKRFGDDLYYPNKLSFSGDSKRVLVGSEQFVKEFDIVNGKELPLPESYLLRAAVHLFK